MKGERNCSHTSATMRQKERQEKRFLRRFDGDGYDDIVIAIAVCRKKGWEIEIRLPSGCIRRRNKKELKS